MAKFAGPSVTPGQPGSIQLPTQQIGEQIPTTQPAPSQTGTFIDDIGAAPEPVEGSEAAALEEQVERERIPDIETRMADKETVQKWTPQASPTIPESDGGIESRAVGMVSAFGGVDPATTLGLTPPTPETRALAKEGFTSAVATQAAERTPGSLVAALNRSGAVTSTQRADNTWSNKVDDRMLMVGSVVTENMLADSAFGTPEEGAVILDPEARTAPVAKAKGNAALGQQIHAEYSRLKNAEQGLPTDQYEKLPDAEANTLGDAFKEMWYKVNGKDLEDAGQPPLVLREETPGGGETFFQLTQLGREKIGASGKYRKRLFNKQVRPAKTPTESGQLPGEQGRTVVKRKTGKVKKALAGAEVLEEATRNLNAVPNVVDAQRLRVLYTTILPVLAGQLDHTSWEATINNIGKKQWAKYSAEETRDQRKRAEDQAQGRRTKGEPYIAAKQMEDITNDVAQEVRAIATERKGANHLTYQIQAATGRIDPQQLHFNPTTSKAVRFVTRNVVPAKATPGSRIARNLEQMYAMMLIKGADVLLPDGRIDAFKKHEQKLEAWGDRLAAALDQSMTDAQAEAISDAIEQGMALTDPNFPSFQRLALDPQQDAELIATIEKKGEDGPHFIDGVIDAAKYIKAKREGRPYHSYFNAYVDGKTNGIASNGIQMGSENIARATGVIRNEDATQLLDAGDIRDQLAAALTSKMDHDGFDGHLKEDALELYDVANVLYNYRDLNKATTMTFSYGKEIASFQDDIKQHLELARQEILNDPDQADSTYPQSLEYLLSDPKWGEDKLVSTLLNFYAQGMAEVLSQEALDSRALVRGAGLMFALTDQLFTIQSPTGFELAMGGERATTPTQDTVTYGIGGKQVQAGRHASYPSSAAAKVRTRDEGETQDRELGGVVHGQAVTSPVHSIDAATVALTAAGKSWDKLKSASNGNPYMHPIYDAFKFDAMGFDVGVQEVNKNWLDSTMDWSYLREAHDSTKTAMDAWHKESQQVPQSTPVDISANGQYAMMGYLLEPQKTKQGVEPARLINKLTKTMEFGKNDNRREVAKDAARRIIRELKDQGIDFRNLPDQVTVKQLRTFIKAVEREINILPRLNKMANQTDRNKQELRKKIKGEENYQYYAH